jgi:hypothetical protein
MSVDSLHCPRCRRELLRSDAEGLFHSRPPDRCSGCAFPNPLREAVFEYVEFKPSAWPGPTLPIVDRHARDD